MKSKIHTLIFLCVVVGFFALFGFIACTQKSNIMSPPIEMPIRLNNAGVVADFSLEIQEHLIYVYLLRFNFPEDNLLERTRIQKVIGGHENPGISTPVILSISKIDKASEEVVYKQEVTPVLISWNAGSFSKKIGHCD